MKISVIDKRTRIPGYALLFLQTILLLVTLYFYMGEKYVDQWQDYCKHPIARYLSTPGQ